MIEHTPGPWLDDQSKIYSARVVRHLSERGSIPIATVSKVGTGVTYEEHEANARLIAAAPDMLAALEKCLPSSCQAASPASPDYAAGRSCGKCGFCLGTAAIAKARGQ